MNPEKAREYFSAYYEDTLDSGLKQAFEQRLNADAQIQSEYRAFARTMDQLSQLQFEEIDVPSYLSDRIATRLESVSERRESAFGFNVWLRRFGWVGAAVVVIGIGIVASNGKISTGSIATVFPSRSSATKPDASIKPLTFSVYGGQVIIDYKPSEPRSVVVTEERTHKAITYPNGINRAPVKNENEGPAVFTIQQAGEAVPTVLVIPGSVKSSDTSGSGTAEEFATALSSHFGLPVVLKVTDLTKQVTWSFEKTDPMGAATKAGYVLEVRDNNLLQIADH